MKTKEDLLIRIAELYYYQNLNQNDIAKIVGVSRPTVSRFLEEAKAEGVVEIVIHNPIKKNVKLSKKLKDELNLKDAIVIEGSYFYEEALDKCSEAAVQLFYSILDNNMSVGITWGKPMSSFAKKLQKRDYYNVEIIQLVGCLGTGNPKLDGLELAIEISKKLNGTYSNIYAPIYVENAEVQKYFLAEKQIDNSLKKASSLDIIVTSVGSLIDDTTTLVTAGYLKTEERLRLLNQGAVGHMVGRMFNREGEELEVPGKYVIGASLDVLKACKWTIAIGAQPKKAIPTYVAAKNGLIDVLVVDEHLANAILKYCDELKKK